MKITSIPFVLNRAGSFAVPADGWIQLAPYGETSAPLLMPGGGEKDAVEIVQVLNRSAADAIATRFRTAASKPNFPGLLIDFDHFSHDTEKSSRAAGWIEAVEARDDGLWGQVRFSASGKTALEGGDYRLFSPVLGFSPRDYKEGERVVPVALLRGALTNDPRYKGMVPVSNRQESLATTHNEQTTDAMDYKSVLIKLLGLLATATDAEIQAAADKKTTESETNKSELLAAQNRATKLEGELIEHDLDKAGLQGDVRTKAKVLLTKNREDGLAFISALPNGADGYRVTHNRGNARPPGAKPAQASKAQQRDAEVQTYQTQNRCSFDAAWNAVRAGKPDLFAES